MTLFNTLCDRKHKITKLCDESIYSKKQSPCIYDLCSIKLGDIEFEA